MMAEDFMKYIEDEIINKGRVHTILWLTEEGGIILPGKLKETTIEDELSIRLHFDKTSYKINLLEINTSEDQDIDALVLDHENYKFMFTTTDDIQRS
ncbi:hypothetical protein [Jeotgalibacillus marinus]|uniref:Uncharacterized protein n=1 Tax=Jeotgalibacillus marinus TaxID=86667 RepID=A0ABV3Q764_9BACL